VLKGSHMRLRSKFQTYIGFVAAGILVLALLSACAATQISTPAVNTPVSVESSPTEANTATPEPVEGMPTEPNVATPEGGSPATEIVVYASDLSSNDLDELDFIDDPASPGGRMISLPNNGDELDPPPENDPHFTFSISVKGGIPYRCWVHLKVGEAKGRSTANVVWVQFSNSVDQANQEVFRPGTDSYLTAQGPTELGWTWVGCDATGSDSLVYFLSNGEATVRIQAGAEGVGFDQFVLSAAKFLSASPSEPIVEK
jgi:hypothetical protein